MEYTIHQVSTSKDKDDFLRLPSLIYKDCPQYVPDLRSEVRKLLLQQCSSSGHPYAVRAFCAYDAAGNVVGRVVGIINHRANAVWGTLCVRFGMIEFLDDIAIPRMLLNAVSQWGRSLGMETIQGPLGITDFDKEGMLVEDFSQTGSMVTIYNPPYYPLLLEKLGFRKQADWVQVRIDIPRELPERFRRVSSLVRQMYGLSVRQLSFTDIFLRGYGGKLFDLLNRAYRPLFGFTEISRSQQRSLIFQYLPLADLRMIPVVEDADGHIVATAITIPSVTEALQKCRGRLMPFGWLHLLKSLKFRHEGKVEMLLMAVDPDYHGLGVNAMLFEYLLNVYNRLGYTWAETGPMLENNLKVLTQWRTLSPVVYKRRRCYCRSI